MKKIFAIFALVVLVSLLPVKVVNADSLSTESSTSKTKQALADVTIHYTDGTKEEIFVPENGLRIFNNSSLRADILIEMDQTIIVLVSGHYEVYAYPEVTEMRMHFTSEGIEILPLARGCEKVRGLPPMDYYDGLYADYYCQ